MGKKTQGILKRKREKFFHLLMMNIKMECFQRRLFTIGILVKVETAQIVLGVASAKVAERGLSTVLLNT